MAKKTKKEIQNLARQIVKREQRRGQKQIQADDQKQLDDVARKHQRRVEINQAHSEA